ncbi:hydrogenase maturation nickel metallochaperone HypA [Candidatus Pacearchaeota archaeon]|nr:hydrogenase maturation nickel metallochaperone HypA [Candidatus Pacearchaeota archaeon]
MHEHSFIQAIISNIENKDNVVEITLEVGELAGIKAEHLKEHLEEEMPWKVDVVERTSKVKCACGYEGRAKIRQRLHDLVVYCCPKCESFPEIIQGEDIKIIKVVYGD